MLEYLLNAYLLNFNFCTDILQSPAEATNLTIVSINNLHNMPAYSNLQDITSHFSNSYKQSWKMPRGSFKYLCCPRDWDKYIKINVSLNRKVFLRVNSVAK